MVSRRAFLAGAIPFAMRAAGAPLRFAVISDVQYADRDTAGRREYRKSIEKLRAAVDLATSEEPRFTIQLGDLIDAGASNLDAVDAVYRKMPAPRYYVLGNHDFFGPRPQVLRGFGLKHAYYSFRMDGWNFIVLDGMSVTDKSILERMKSERAVNAFDWNGALGPKQREWLRASLRRAGKRREPSVIFCHFPTLAAACRPEHLLWDHREALSIIESEPSAVAWMNGHDHNGGYAEHNGIHHVTLAGLVENDVTRCLRIVDAFPDRLMLREPGREDGQVLRLRAIRSS